MKSRLGIIFLTIFLDLVGFGIVLPLLPVFARAHRAQEWQIGLLMATYSLMQFFFAPIWGRLSDRIGRRPVLLASVAGSALSYLLFAAAPDLPWLFASRALAGIMAANIATAQAYIADVTDPENRTRGMGLVGAAFGLGFIVGPWIGGEAARLGERLLGSGQAMVGLTAAAFSLADLALAAARLPESLTAERRKAAAASGSRLRRMAAAIRHPALGVPVLLFFLTTVAWSQLEPTAARLAQEAFGFRPWEVGRMFAYMGLIAAIVQGGLAGRLARRLGERRMVVLGTALLGLGLLLVPWVAARHCRLGLLGAMGVLGIGQATNLPALQGLISRRAAAEEQGSTLGVTQGFSSLARVIGPAVGGALFGIEHAYPFWFGAALMGLAVMLAWRLARSEA